MKKRKHVYLPESTLNKLEEYAKNTHILANTVVELAIESYVLDEVDVEILTTKEAKEMWSKVNSKMQQLKELEAKLFEILEDD